MSETERIYQLGFEDGKRSVMSEYMASGKLKDRLPRIRGYCKDCRNYEAHDCGFVSNPWGRCWHPELDDDSGTYCLEVDADDWCSCWEERAS